MVCNLGTPLLDPEHSQEILEAQLVHASCLQDIKSGSLYAEVGQVVKGGVTLPKYRCARGTTSLESFHAHVVNFILGVFA